MIYWRYLPHQSEIDRMASRNATRQIFVEKRIVKELTIKFWRNAIWNTQTETLTNGLRTHAAYIRNFTRRTLLGSLSTVTASALMCWEFPLHSL